MDNTNALLMMLVTTLIQFTEHAIPPYEGPNICYETYPVLLYQNVTIPMIGGSRDIYCCESKKFDHGRRCVKTCFRYLSFFNKTKTVMRPYYQNFKKNVCCQGYQQNGRRCTPILRQCACVNGYCNGHGKCVCQTGFEGERCEIDKCIRSTLRQRLCGYKCLSPTHPCICSECYQNVQGMCVHKYTCYIDGKCYLEHSLNLRGCGKCIPAQSKLNWTSMDNSKFLSNDCDKNCTKNVKDCITPTSSIREVGKNYQSTTKHFEVNEISTIWKTDHSIKKSMLTSASAKSLKPTKSTFQVLQTVEAIETEERPPPPPETEGSSYEITCDGKASGLYRMPEDCTKFYYCIFGHDKPYIRDCYPGTAFSEATNTCSRHIRPGGIC